MPRRCGPTALLSELCDRLVSRQRQWRLALQQFERVCVCMPRCRSWGQTMEGWEVLWVLFILGLALCTPMLRHGNVHLLVKHALLCWTDLKLFGPWAVYKPFPFSLPTALSCPENSHYNICMSACPESCGSSYNVPCPWACYEGCQCDPGYMQSGNGCVKAEKCGCLYHGHYYEGSTHYLAFPNYNILFL